MAKRFVYLMLKETYFLLLSPPPPPCAPSSIDLIASVSSLGVRFSASEEAITMLLSNQWV